MKIIQINHFIIRVTVLQLIMIEWNLCIKNYISEETKNRKGMEWKAPESYNFYQVAQKLMVKKFQLKSKNCIRIILVDNINY